MYLVSGIDYNRFSITRNGCFKSFSPYLLVIAIALLIAVLIPGVGVEKNLARRWLSIPLGPASVSFQPSELAKWAVVIFLAALLDFFGNSIKQYKKRFLPVCAITGIVCALIVTQDFGTAAFIGFIAFIMLLIAGARWLERLRAFFVTDSQSPATYHAQQSLIAISTGGIWGKGLGHGISKYGHLPEDTTDFIFAIISEELGFAGSFTVIALFAILTIAAVILVRRCNSMFGRMLASSIIITIALQAVVNIGVVTVVLPTKGIPLPFVSAGGTSLLLSAAAAGILLNIARQTSYENIMSPSFARMNRLISSAASEADIVSHTVTVLDASAYKTAENRVFSTRWAPFAEDDPAEKGTQVDAAQVVTDIEEDVQIDAVSVADNAGAMVLDDDKIENKPVITNPLFEIIAVDKSENQTENQTEKNPQPPAKQEVTASSQLPDDIEKAADDFLFDADLESKALRAANAISWDEEEDPDEIWMGGSSVNSSSNKNFWEES